MTFVRFGRKRTFVRNEFVDIHVREAVINPDAPESKRVEAIDIREFLKEGEIYGHGLTIPKSSARDLKVALDLLTREEATQ